MVWKIRVLSTWGMWDWEEHCLGSEPEPLEQNVSLCCTSWESPFSVLAQEDDRRSWRLRMGLDPVHWAYKFSERTTSCSSACLLPTQILPSFSLLGPVLVYILKIYIYIYIYIYLFIQIRRNKQKNDALSNVFINKIALFLYFFTFVIERKKKKKKKKK